MVQKVGFFWAVSHGGQVRVWLRCGGMKLELQKETASGVSRSTARGMSGSCSVKG